MKKDVDFNPELHAWAQAVEPPAAPADFSERMWQRLEPQLAALPQVADKPQRRPWHMALGGLAAAAALVVLLAWPHAASTPAASPVAKVVASNAKPDPILLLAVSDHLDRTQALLIQLSHAADHTDGKPVPLAAEQGWARQLVAANRLYQQGAELAGDASMAHLLSTLEPVLTELSHSPAHVTPAAWQRLQARIHSSGVLFQVRIVDQQLQMQVAHEEQAGDL